MGPTTKSAVRAFQRKHKLVADGIVGSLTIRALRKSPASSKKLKFKKIVCDDFVLGGIVSGANQTWIREDAVSSLAKVRDTIQSAGALFTSHGGRRLLSASVGKNRSKTSLHYLGLAHDLHTKSGMVDPYNDPYVVVQSLEDHRRWTVYARVDYPIGTYLELEAYTYEHKKISVAGNYINITELMAENGWKSIRARKSFFSKGNTLAAEWWHFQNEDVLKKGVTFGSELIKSYKLKKLKSYPLWKRNGVKWQKNWF